MRRSLIQTVLFSFALLAIGAVPPAGAASPCTGTESAIAGFHFYQGRALWPLLGPGEPLRLVREAANPFDPLAVAVYWGEFKLGYVDGSCPLAKSLDGGQSLQAQVASQESGPLRRLTLRIVPGASRPKPV